MCIRDRYSSPDAKAWVFKIRKGVQFHNGKTLTPDDVVATMERHSGPGAKSGALGIMRGIDGIEFVTFTDRDVVRHRLVQMIIRAYEEQSRKGLEAAP